MRHRLWLAAYLAAVVAVTLVHQPLVLALGLAAVVAAAGPGRWRLLGRSVLAVLAFNLVVSLGYAAMALWRGEFRGDYLLLVNLGVLLLVFLGFWTVSRVNLPRALAFSPTLAFVATLAAGQVQGFRRLVEDFALAFRSRNPEPPGPRERARLTAAQGQHLLDRALHRSTDVGQAMRSRGCFDD